MTKMSELWDKAAANPGETVKVGRLVVCDDCNEDWTDSETSGGLIFELKAICPNCAPLWIKEISRHDEERFVRARCPDNQSFADFVRAWRGPDAGIKISTELKP